MVKSPRDREVLVSRGMLAFAGSLNAMGLRVSSSALRGVKTWLNFYYRWDGRRTVGFPEPELVAAKLLADSFSFGMLEPSVSGLHMMDLGSGNGWPGLALKLSHQKAELILLDSRQGACDFMGRYVVAAGLEGVRVTLGRAEELGRRCELRESQDLVVSRAMAMPPVVLELASPFVRAGGQLVLWVGREQAKRLAEYPVLKELGIRLSDIVEYTLPSGLGGRALVVYSKVQRTDPGYPRRFAKIRGKPIF